MTELQHRPLDTTLDLGLPGGMDGPPKPSESPAGSPQTPGFMGETVAIDLRELGLPVHAPKHPTHTAETWSPQVKEEAVRYTDVELLGRSYRVERAVAETGRQAVGGYKVALAKIRNTFAMPGHAIKQFAHDRALESYKRVEARVEQARQDNAGPRMMRRHNKALDEASDRLTDKSAKLQEHTKRMEERHEKAHGHAETSRQRHIAALRQKRVDALGQKAVRQGLRSQGNSRREAKETAAEIPQEQIDRVGAVAIVHETSRRRSDEHAHHHRKVERAKAKTERSVAKAGAQARTHENDSWWHEDVAALIGDQLSKENYFDPNRMTAGQRVDALQAQLQVEAKLRETTPKDPAYDFVEAQLREAQKGVASLNKNFARHEKAAAASRQSAARATSHHARLQGTYRIRQTAAINAVVEAAAHRQVEEGDRVAVAREVQRVLGADRTKERGE